MDKKTYEQWMKAVSFQPNTDEPAWLQKIRQAAFDAFHAKGFPSRKEEAWRYTPLERLLKLPIASSLEKPLEISDEHTLDKYNLAKDGEHRVAFLNNHRLDKYSLPQSLPKGVLVEPFSQVLANSPDQLKPYFNQLLGNEKTNAFAHANTFSFTEGAFVYIPENTKVSFPVHLFFGGLGSDSVPLFYPRLLVVLAEGAELNLITSHVSLNESAYFVNGAVELFVGKQAKLHWTMVQRHTDKMFKIVNSKASLAEKSSFERVSFVEGGELTHNEMDVVFEGDHAECQVEGLSVLSGASQVSELVSVEHRGSHCTSRQVFKNILADKSQAEFNSVVQVDAGTHGSSSNQLNRNLILSDHARAYSRPQLKIDSDDVTATHGSATGQLSEQELFYLRSRGFDPALARFVLTYGFAEEILEKIKSDSIRWQLEIMLRKEIQSMVNEHDQAHA